MMDAEHELKGHRKTERRENKNKIKSSQWRYSRLGNPQSEINGTENEARPSGAGGRNQKMKRKKNENTIFMSYICVTMGK